MLIWLAILLISGQRNKTPSNELTANFVAPVFYECNFYYDSGRPVQPRMGIMSSEIYDISNDDSRPAVQSQENRNGCFKCKKWFSCGD